MNELTKKDVNNFKIVYKNVFNETTIPDLSVDEHNLLMMVVSRLDRKDESEVTIPFNQISEVIDSKYVGHPQRTIALIDSLWDKIKNVDYKLYAGNQSAGGVLLFSYLSANKEKKVLEVKINPDLKYFVNDFEEGRYSSLDYRDFKRTADKYGKLLFRLLMQWKNVGHLTITFKELAYKLDASPAYRKSGMRLNDRVLKPAIKSIRPLMKNFDYEIIKSGHMISGYSFNFQFLNGPELSREELIEVTSSNNSEGQNKSSFKDNFTNGYIKGQNLNAEEFRNFLNMINFYTSEHNREYFNIRKTIKGVLMKSYSMLVIKKPDDTWTSMTFLACVQYNIRKDRPLTTSYIEDAYHKVKDIFEIDYLFDKEIIDKLPDEDIDELNNFITGDVI